MSKRDTTVEDYLLNRSFPEPMSGCWLWTGYCTDKGYSLIKNTAWHKEYGECLGHRLSYLIWKGESPKGKFVCHKCDNPCCVNPDHLYLGTNKDNMEDRQRAGNYKSGAEHPRWAAVLDEEQVAEIKYLLQTMYHKDIAELYGVSRTNIYHISSGNTWKHVEPAKSSQNTSV